MKDRDVAFQLLPITFNGLVIENTNSCNARCSMCYQSSGPKGSDLWGKHQLNNDVIKKTISDAISIKSLTKRFHLAGGEAFIYPNDCFNLFQHALDEGYENITTTTNCYWGNKPEKAALFARRLRHTGVTQIEISWDIWHLPYINPEKVNNVIFACVEQEIYVNLRILTTKLHSIHEALTLLNAEAIDLVNEISSGPVFNTGRAVHELDQKEFFSGGNLGGNCHSVLHLTVNSRGDVYPCCAGADQTASLSFGNIHRDSIVDVYKRMNESRLLRTLVFYGIGALVPILKKEGVNMNCDHNNICELCWDIFSNSNRATIIKDHFKRLRKYEEQKLVAAIENSHYQEVII